jgi:hypothetical protein
MEEKMLCITMRKPENSKDDIYEFEYYRSQPTNAVDIVNILAFAIAQSYTSYIQAAKAVGDDDYPRYDQYLRIVMGRAEDAFDHCYEVMPKDLN